MWVEASLDFPEEDLELIAAARIREKVGETLSALDRLLENARQGALLRRGLHVVIAGAPNVGKSSLLNALMGEERAIVTDIAGTTRDVLREAIQIEGIPLYVIDTAGLRATDDPVERIGVARTREAISQADAVLALRALDRPEAAPLEEVLALAPPEVPVIEVVNKIDLPEVQEKWKSLKKELEKRGYEPYAISALTRQEVKPLLWKAARVVANGTGSGSIRSSSSLQACAECPRIHD